MHRLERKPLPRLLYADERGRLFDAPGLAMAGFSGGHPIRLYWDDLIPLPPGSDLYLLPSRPPIGWDEESKTFACLEEFHAVGAFVAPAYTLRATAAYRENPQAPRLPLNAYAPVGFWKGRYFTAAFRVDPDPRQDVEHFDCERIQKNLNHLKALHPANSALRQMEKCALEYGCPAARNFLLGRFEAPMPTSTGCNARCVGCLSLQPANEPPSPMQRLRERIQAQDIETLIGPHLENVPRAIASFGQGCEGEPLTKIALLCDVLQRLRKKTTKGTLNLNSNAGYPQAVEDAAKAGLDSIRVSLNSARKKYYEAYFRPADYTFEDVVESIRRAKQKGLFVSLNYFTFPGFTDQPEELHALLELLKETRPDYIQMRNLNMDPSLYLQVVGRPKSAGFGMDRVLDEVHRAFPGIRFGYFNPPKEWWGKSGSIPPEHRLYSKPNERAKGFPSFHRKLRRRHTSQKKAAVVK